MRDFSKIRISEKIGIEIPSLDKENLLVAQTLRELFDLIYNQDKKIINELEADKRNLYICVETYFMLLDYIEWVDEHEIIRHTPNNCKACGNRRRVLYLVDCLIHRWKMAGAGKTFENAVRFRDGALEETRTIN